MISDPNLVLYACVSKGTTILAEFTSGDPNLSTLASQCLEKTPPFHSVFSHTIRKRRYTFLIGSPDPFVYFSIVDENLEQSEGFWFLNRLKDALDGNIQRNLIACSEIVSSYCLQGEFKPIFRKLLASRVKEFALAGSVESVLTKSRHSSLDDSSKGKKIVSVPLLGKPCKAWFKLKNKKRFLSEKNVDAKDNVNENKADVIENRELPVPLHKNGLYLGDSGRHKTNQLWRRHVSVVLVIDLIVCSLLFAAWLWICRGFKCIAE